MATHLQIVRFNKDVSICQAFKKLNVCCNICNFFSNDLRFKYKTSSRPSKLWKQKCVCMYFGAYWEHWALLQVLNCWWHVKTTSVNKQQKFSSSFLTHHPLILTRNAGNSIQLCQILIICWCWKMCIFPLRTLAHKFSAVMINVLSR